MHFISLIPSKDPENQTLLSQFTDDEGEVLGRRAAQGVCCSLSSPRCLLCGLCSFYSNIYFDTQGGAAFLTQKREQFYVRQYLLQVNIKQEYWVFHE